MNEKLQDYQVLDVLCGGTFYKVRHKVTNNIFAWKAYNCCGYSDENIQNIVNEIKIISKVQSENILRYYDTILHAPSRTLYFVLEYNSWRTLEEIITTCKDENLYIAECFIWNLLHELAKVCKAFEGLSFFVLRKCISAASTYVKETGDIRVNCFELVSEESCKLDVMLQVGRLIHSVCHQPGSCDDDVTALQYSNDLLDVVSFLNDSRNSNLRPDAILYHPTVLANLENQPKLRKLSDVMLKINCENNNSEVNKCDSEKAVELCKSIQPAPRSIPQIGNSPIYCNISPKRSSFKTIEESDSPRNSLSPTLAALALELPGFVPRCRKPMSGALETYKPQQVSQATLSDQWLARLIALRQREESLNKRERDILSKEILSSPAAKVVPLSVINDNQGVGESNGITLPRIVSQIVLEDREEWVSRRRHRHSSSTRTRSKTRRKTFAYEDLDSSLSADAGDESMIVTATKFTKENMPRRNIFPDIATKKVHFTTANPFVESDDSVTLTFYELDNVDRDGYQVPRTEDKLFKDITKFKYLDLEKVTSEKRCAMQQLTQSSPSKQARVTSNIFSDITNQGNIKKTPSKTSLTSKGSMSSRFSLSSGRSHWSSDSGVSKVSQDNISDRTRASVRQSLAPPSSDPADRTRVSVRQSLAPPSSDPADRTRASVRQSLAPPSSEPAEVKKTKTRKSLLPFKTPFKFRTSTKV